MFTLLLLSCSYSAVLNRAVAIQSLDILKRYDFVTFWVYNNYFSS